MGTMTRSTRSGSFPSGDAWSAASGEIMTRGTSNTGLPEKFNSSNKSSRSAGIRGKIARSRRRGGRWGSSRPCLRKPLKALEFFRRSGGAGGIRTLDRALQPYNGLANRRLQPLGHSSISADMPDASASRKRQIQITPRTFRGARRFARIPHQRPISGIARLGACFRALWSR